MLNTGIYEYHATQNYHNILYLATDWWVIGATITTGVLAAIATVLAVIFTNKSNAKRFAQELENSAKKYEHELEKQRLELERQRKEKALVFLKPELRHTRFIMILENLIYRDIWDKMLLLPRDDDFEYFNDISKWYNFYRFLFIKNESTNDIRMLKVSVASTLLLKDNSGGTIHFNKSYIIKFFRSKDTIIVPLYGNLQEEKLHQPHANETMYILEFNCKIEYITMAEQQISHEYAGEIPTTVKLEFKDKKKSDEIVSYPEPGTPVIINDAPGIPSDECVLDINESPSSCINLQDKISHIDRMNYVHRKIGEAQTAGIVDNIKTNTGPLTDLFDYAKERIVKPIGGFIDSLGVSDNNVNAAATQPEAMLLCNKVEESEE